jgi:structure-specific recognition protein 1
VDDKLLTLKHNKASLLRIPVKKIMNSNTQKNDIVLQLNTDELDPK